jgi:ABC-type transport system involved in multi-copper enzyme maturation permease subunit
MRAIFYDCLTEFFARKMIYIFAVVTVIVMAMALYSGSIEFGIGGGSEMGLDELNQALGNPLMHFFSGFLSFLVFLAVIGTANLVPGMLIRGRADYYLSKPISRTSLMLSKLTSIFMVYGLLIFVCGILVYLSQVIVHGGFSFRIIYLLLFSLMSFFIWLSITVFVGIVSGSQAVSIMGAFLVWIGNTVFAQLRDFNQILGSKSLGGIVDVVYYILPKNSEMVDIGFRLAMDKKVYEWMPLYTSVAFAVVLMFLMLIVFNKKSY